MGRFWSGLWKAGMAVAVLVPGGGCTGLATSEPLGEAVEAVDRDKLEGVWDRGDGLPCIVKFGQDGVGRMTCLNPPGEDPEIGRSEIIPTAKTQRHHVLSIRSQEESGKWLKKWHFVGYKFQCPYLIFWLPDLETFNEASNTGELQWTWDGDDFVITNWPEVIVQVMNDQDRDWFDYTDPIVLRRLAPPCRDNEPESPAEATREPGGDKESEGQEPPSEKPRAGGGNRESMMSHRRGGAVRHPNHLGNGSGLFR